MRIKIAGQDYRTEDLDFIGAGGEAEIYRLGTQAVKLYHASMLTPERQRKLQHFPKGLPSNVLAPQELVMNSRGDIAGFTMTYLERAEPYLQLANPTFRSHNITPTEVMTLLGGLLQTLGLIHKSSLVIGDFNNLNVLFKDHQSYLVDVDSMQYGNFSCTVAMQEFLAPELFNLNLDTTTFKPQHDYYAYAVLLFMSLLYLHPYGGVHKKIRSFVERATAGVTIFNPEVRYPKSAIPYERLSDELLQYFHNVFEQGQRYLLDNTTLRDVRWTHCTQCNTLHARHVCPRCQAGKSSVVVSVNDHCLCDKIFETKGAILAHNLGSRLHYLYYLNGTLYREHDRKLATLSLGVKDRLAVLGDKTILGRGSNLLILNPDNSTERLRVGTFNEASSFDCNSSRLYYVRGDELVASNNDPFQPYLVIGKVLTNQTWFKVGATLGFGFYRVGRQYVYFRFDPNKPHSLNDQVNLPQVGGQLVGVNASFSDDHIVFAMSVVDQGKTLNHLYLLDCFGQLVAKVVDEPQHNSLVANIYGLTLGGDQLLVATDEGLLLAKPQGGLLQEVKLYVDTAPFVAAGMYLASQTSSIYTITTTEIQQLRLT